ncbi:uncharacterized protein LOC9638964 isoform X2 [Selaginella moellendorffii]|uniref:uncharacterized protein LOC9638964 isoform X2 n=1 Tax=Selaginella moellendorffii TaxID=88036 RepID=UPI000D1C7E8F|nr:uncharacterized protein LOC9638964 isoform X2 [Selaginella moellendorffii]|eukprot:XP_024537999.1 uncharacterized protein LOC9638964 isoform X2 [Selaginella moellendorffii]
MVLEAPGSALKLTELPIPEPRDGQVRVKVSACAVCRTDLHVVDGELKEPNLPIIPGHEIVGLVDKIGRGVDPLHFSIGARVGIPWLGRTCGSCSYCVDGTENLCDEPGFTGEKAFKFFILRSSSSLHGKRFFLAGYTIDGGYAEYAVANSAYCFSLPENYPDVKASPLLCAGLIGYRSLRMAGFTPGMPKPRKFGIYGFGAAAHIAAQVLRHEGHEVYGFTRPGDVEAQAFARKVGATWSGDSTASPPQLLDAAIIFASVGSLVPLALAAIRKGGVVVCGGIYMTPVPSIPYAAIWGERRVVSVANLTRLDAIEFLRVASSMEIKTETVEFRLEEANEALRALREGKLNGAAVLVPGI